ncbi:MAG: hypothetical protein QOF01_2059 [Thermomicrobiales bacterium]|nr:hypothetical protein [Thermomicrobiales bacterium]
MAASSISQPRASLRPKEIGALLLLAALWGGSFMFFRIAAPALGPIVVAFLRVLIAGGALLLFARFTGHGTDWRRTPRSFLILGALNGAIPYALTAAAALNMTASLAAILNATTPLFAVAVVAARLGERPTVRTIIGLAIGVSGVVVLLGWNRAPFDAAFAASVAASLAAAISYAFAGAYAKSAFAGTPSLTLAIGQQFGAAVVLAPVLIPVGIVGREDLSLTRGVAAAVIALALLCTSVASLLYFFLIRSVGPTKTLTITFLVPIFGVLWGALFLDESIGTATLLGLSIVLIGVTLVTGLRLRPRANGRRASAQSAT